MSKEEDITIQGDADLSGRFFSLLEKGVEIEVMVGLSLTTFMIDQLSIDPDYIEDQIQTLFLNAKPVDDPDTAIVNDGDLLALSGAMPGLVGATLRKKGRYAPMRREISAIPADVSGITSPVKGRIRLKLFNTVLVDLGPAVLACGVTVSAVDLAKMLQVLKDHGWENHLLFTFQGAAVSLNKIMTALDGREYVRLKVISL